MSKFGISNIIDADTPGVAKYLATKTIGVYTEADWLSILQWIWLDNPFADSPDKTLGWLIRDEDKNICGVLGNIPVQCTVNGETKNSFWATSWFVDETVRNESLGLFMRYLRQQGVLMSNTPNLNVEKMLVKAFKYKRADSPWFQGSHVFPLKPFQGFFSIKNKGGNIFKKLCVLVFGLLLKMPQAFIFLKERFNKMYKEISVEQVQDFSKATDDWYEEFSKQHNCSLVRSAEMYRWIFLHPQHKNVFTALEVVYQKRVLGYLVFKEKYNAGGGFYYMELIDEALLPAPEAVRKAVTGKTYYRVNKLAKKQSLLIMRSNDENTRKVLRNFAGVPISKVEKTYYREPFLQKKETPFLTSLDGDSVFF